MQHFSLKTWDHLEDLRVDAKVILKCILKKCGGRAMMPE
jgi:hypothetical protein